MNASQPMLSPAALARFANLDLVARWVVEGFLSGIHQSPFHGSSVEFAEYRPYVRGDDLKYLDWKTLAKSDRLYIKRFHSETNLKCHILLDTSASMGYGSGDMTKFRYAQCLAAALSYLLVMRQIDAVGLVTFDEGVRDRLPPRASARHLKDIFGVLSRTEPGKGTKIADTLHDLARSLPQRGLVVLLSDGYDDEEALVAGLEHFRYRKHEVLFFQLFDPAEIDFPFQTLADFRDMETGETIQVVPGAYRQVYVEEFARYVEAIHKACSDHQIEHQAIDTRTPFDLWLARYLNRRSKVL
ncbi:MAG: DUF58 domain-containing protein [Planctomycetes bacterium]|nr:DUF58 domain-containing protein [Planctomycetota bacterium]